MGDYWMKKYVTMILLTAALSTFLTACGSSAKNVAFSIDDYYSIVISGEASGSANAYVSIDEDGLMEAINDAVYDGERDEIEVLSVLLYIEDAVDYDFVGENTELKNGDTVSVGFTIDSDKLSEDVFGDFFVTINGNALTETVSGLAEPVKLDVLTDVVVSFGGTAPNGAAKVEYVGSNDFIKKNVYYRLDKSSGLSNGDTVVVTAQCSQSSLDEYLYYIDENAVEKSFTIEGLAYMAYTFDGLDTEQVDSVMNETNAKKIESYNHYKVGEKEYGHFVMTDGTLVDYYTINAVDTHLMAKYLYVSPDKTSNAYIIFYEQTIDFEKTSGSRDENPIGYQGTLNFYRNVVVKNIEVTSVGALEEITDSNVSSNVFGNGLLSAHNFIGMSFAETVELYEEDNGYSDWTRTEVQ